MPDLVWTTKHATTLEAMSRFAAGRYRWLTKHLGVERLEVVHEAWLAGRSAFGSYSPERGDWGAFCQVVCLRHAHRFLTQQATVVTTPINLPARYRASVETVAFAPESRPAGRSPEAVLMRMQQSALFRSMAIDALTHPSVHPKIVEKRRRVREAVLSVWFDGDTPRQAAKALEIDPNAVYQAAFRAKERIQNHPRVEDLRR